MKIKDIPKEIRPREKALRNGIETLADDELIALIIGSGVKGHNAIEISREILSNHFYSLKLIMNNNLESLKEYKGLKEINALKLLAVFEFCKRVNQNDKNQEMQITNSDDVYIKYKFIEDYDQEVLILLMLDFKHRIKKEKILYKGTSESFLIKIDEVIREVILSKTKLFILIHNHPNECSEPSNHDIITTRMIEKSCKNLSVKLVDHIIIYKGGYYSFRKINNYFTN